MANVLRDLKTSELILGVRPENISVHKEKEKEEDIEVVCIEDFSCCTLV